MQEAGNWPGNHKGSSAKCPSVVSGTINYWTSEHLAELDVMLQKKTNIIGIEVKKGTKVRSRSLGVFIQKYAPSYSIRFSEKNFGKTKGVISIPLYAAFCIVTLVTRRSQVQILTPQPEKNPDIKQDGRVFCCPKLAKIYKLMFI